MYPFRDFRSLIRQKPTHSNEYTSWNSQIIRSMSREAFPEILRYWEQTNKPTELYDIYAQGIEEAIARDRYPIYQLKDVSRTPEFKEAVQKGLQRLWIKCRCAIKHDDEGLALLIDSSEHPFINIPEEDKLKMLKINSHQKNLNFTINGVDYQIRLVPSKRAQEIHRFLN